MNIKLTKNILVTGSIIIALIIAGIINTYSNNREFTVKDNTLINSEYEEDDHSNKTSEKEDILNEENIFEGQNTASSTENSVVTVFVSGEVLHPQVITLEKGKRLIDAIEFCGGLTDKANMNAVNLALILQEEHHYIIPAIGENAIYENSPSSSSNNSDIKDELVDINNSQIEMLKTLPGIGDVLAQRIIDKRDELGGFKSIDQLQEVSGIGEKKFQDIKDKVIIK